MTSPANRPRVFLLEELRPASMSNAGDYGDIVFIFPRSTRPCSIFSEKFTDEILDRLEAYRYDPAIDFYCFSGIMSACAIAIVAIATEYGEFKCLLYDGRRYTDKILGEPFEDSDDSNHSNHPFGDVTHVGPSQTNVS
jgi:hypothetical protein